MNKYLLAIANDHQGFELKKLIILKYDHKYNFLDLGCHSSKSVDYPLFADELAKVITIGKADFGILICASGIGMSIAANRHPGIRAALCLSPEMAELARLHNDANILVVGSKLINPKHSFEIVDRFLATDFAGGRHLERIKQLS